MIFTIMNRDAIPLVNRGYRLSEAHETIRDRRAFKAIVREKGTLYAERILADFADREPVCLGEDGVFYTVLFDTISFDGEAPMSCPVAWHEIEVIMD